VTMRQQEVGRGASRVLLALLCCCAVLLLCCCCAAAALLRCCAAAVPLLLVLLLHCCAAAAGGAAALLHCCAAVQLRWWDPPRECAGNLGSDRKSTTPLSQVPMVIVSHDREFLDQLCTKVWKCGSVGVYVWNPHL
jgi:hypothetical protein